MRSILKLFSKIWFGMLVVGMFITSNVRAEFPVINFQSLVVDEYISTDPESSLVRVSGFVKKRQVRNGPLVLAEGVLVRFWQPDRPRRFISTETDINGRYEIGLEAGLWFGEACGSGQAFSPSRWEALIGDNELLSLKAIEQPSLELNAVLPAYVNRAGEEVIIQGKGFGCNGKLVFQYTNSVKLDGTVEPVSYHQAPFELSSFNSMSAYEIKFNLPQLFQTDELKARHVAKAYYQRGLQRSNAIILSQFINDQVSGSPELEGELELGGDIYQGGNIDLIETDSGINDLGSELISDELMPNEHIQEDNLGNGIGVFGGSPLADQEYEGPSESRSQSETSSQSTDQVIEKQRALVPDGLKGGLL